MLIRGEAMQTGFTLIEILVSLTVLGVLLVIGLPAFGEWLQTQQLRTASEAALNGLQAARGEAIRRNLAVQVVFGPGTGWTVSEAASGTVIQTRQSAEGTPNAVFTVVNGPSNTPATVPPDTVATTTTFNPLGGIVANGDGSVTATKIDVSNPVGGSCQPAGPMRCLRVTISGGGSLKMCDPLAAAPDPRTC